MRCIVPRGPSTLRTALGIASTGNRVEITGISIMRIEGGKIEEIWENYDALGMLQQFGVVPPQA
jgi:predicted ester cyclase